MLPLDGFHFNAIMKSTKSRKERPFKDGEFNVNRYISVAATVLKTPGWIFYSKGNFK